MSTTGLFANRTTTGGRAFAARRARQAAEKRQFIDLFADCLAEGGEVQLCAARLGKSASWGVAALADIRRGLGWQAQ